MANNVESMGLLWVSGIGVPAGTVPPAKNVGDATVWEGALGRVNMRKDGVALMLSGKSHPAAARTQIMLFKCLPDTVDPRGPKAK